MGQRGPGSIPTRRPFDDTRARKPPFSPEILRLFLALEAEINRGVSRGDREFREKSFLLAQMLGLENEFLSVDDVFDRGGPPSMPLARENWKRCRAVRLDLLAAVAGADAVTNVTAQGSQPA